MRLANKPSQNQVTAEFLAAAQALPALDLAIAADAVAMPLLPDEPLQAQADEVNTQAQDFQAAAADSSALAAYVAPPVYDDEPLLLAQASGGLGETRGSSQGQVAGRATPKPDEDDNSAWWWVGGLGLLALAAGGGSSGNDTPARDPRSPVDFVNDFEYSNASGTTTVPVAANDQNGVKVTYSGQETRFEFNVATSGNANTASFVFTYDPVDKDATIVWTVNGTSQTRTAAFDESLYSFSAWLNQQLTELGTTPTVTGNDVTFSLNGFTYKLSLDNSAGNGNLINSLTVTYDNGAFTLTTQQAETTAQFAVGQDAFAAGTYLVDDNDLTAFLSTTTEDYFVVVHDTANINNIDMRPEDGVQILVYNDAGNYCVVTLSEQPVSYAQLFINNSYSTITA